MTGYKDIAVVGLAVAGLYILSQSIKGVTDTINNTFSTVERTFSGFEKTIRESISIDHSSTIIERNKDSLNPSGTLWQQTTKNPFGQSNLEYWQTERNRQIGKPYDSATVWSDISRMHSQTVPTNLDMLFNIQSQQPAYWRGLEEFRQSSSFPDWLNAQRYSSGGVSNNTSINVRTPIRIGGSEGGSQTIQLGSVGGKGIISGDYRPKVEPPQKLRL